MTSQVSNMAFSGSRALEKREVRQEDQEEPRRSATAADQDYCQQRYSLLLIIGQTAHVRQTGHIGREIERGIRSWDIDLNTCNLNLHLQEFLTCYTVSFKGAGQKCLRHSAKVLDTQVLISPSQEQVHSEVSALLVRNSAHKILILAGQSEEQSGDLLFHRGLFSPHHLKQLLKEQFINQECSAAPSSSSKFNLTLCCPNIGEWRTTLSGDQSLQGPFTVHINPPEVLPNMETLGEFTSLVSGTLTSSSTFDLLPPPTTVGFLKLSRPCCYVFPAGRGDCAFFAVNGFTVLVDGGSDAQACFWKLVRHLDRVDAILLTHIGTENLPGVNTFLERKVSELELRSDLKDDMSKRLISPELGVVFFNAPSRLEKEQQPSMDAVLRSSQQGALTLHLLKRLEIIPQPMFRTQGVPIEPITLFQKMGVGQLDLYVLNPSKNSQEYQMFMQNWPDGVSSASKSQSLPLTALASVSALLVWHPACPQEKVVRVLFPGVTPQTKLLQGLEKLKGLAFLQKPTVTTGDLEKLSEDKKAKRRESQDSGKSQGKETGLKHVKDRGTREENKDVSAKEKGKVFSGVVGDKTKIKEVGGKQKAASTEKRTPKKGTGKDGKKDEKTGNKEENGVNKNGQVKKDSISSKPRNDARAKGKKESKNESKTGAKNGKKSAGKEGNDINKTDLSDKIVLKPDTENVLEIQECTATEERSPKVEKEPEENPCGSKTSTPEDITADFLRLREETASDTKQKSSESENEKILGGLSNGKSNEAPDSQREETAGGPGMMRACSVDNEVQDEAGAGDKDGAEKQDPTGNVSKPAKVVGFPAPLNKTPKSQRSVQLDLTPTEYTLLDGALKHSPPSRSSPANQVPVSPDEETVEPTSPDSRPNSAGHTPYCLSPDDVWCNRVTLSTLQAQMSNSDESPDVNQTNVSSRQSEGQPCQSRNNTESHANHREKHLSFLSLGTFKEASSDPSPSVATTTTTHSMPAEVSSPQSTEVDESLSMSFEHGSTNVSQRESDDSTVHSHSNGTHFVGMSLGMKKPPRSLGQGSDSGRPPAPSSLHFESSPHDVDLCLVSPCEFKHFKPSESGESCRGNFAPHYYSTNNNNPKDTSPSESNAPVCTEDCPSTTADGALDSDEDESCSEPTHSPRDLCASQALPSDPLPVPLRDSPPLPPHPDTCMPVPQSNLDAQGKRLKASSMMGKKMPGVVDGSNKSGSGKKRTGSQSGVSSTRTPSFSSRSAPAKSPPNTGSKTTPAGEVSVYVDLAYVPSGASSSTVSVDFFRCVRSSCYIISGDSPEREELMRQTLDALFEGKNTWSDTMQVTVIPTYESVSMQEWYQQTLDRQRELGITVLGSNSTVAMQDETFPACKIEF